MVYFFWTHPDTEEGQSYECQIIPVNAPPLPAETASPREALVLGLMLGVAGYLVL